MLAASSVAAATRTPALIALAGAASFTALWQRSAPSLKTLRPYGGYANWLTAARLTLILGAAALMDRLSALQMLFVFAANVAMDVGDGLLARRNDQVTRVGGIFDRETDGVFVLVAYMYFFVAEDVAAWILLPALLPYVYVLVVWGTRDSPAPQEKQKLAAMLAGVNFVVLTVAVVAPAPLQMPMLVASTGVVALSFAVSFWNVFRDAHPIPQ